MFVKPLYFPILCVQKCKTTRVVTYAHTNISATKQATFFIKNSAYENQLWKLPENTQNTTELLQNLQSKLRY